MSVGTTGYIDDSASVYDSTTAERIGSRIRDIRTTKEMSQAELGEKLGLTADRIQKYENGARKPKLELLHRIANALEVNVMALTDPVISDITGVMYALFEMEKIYGLKIEDRNGYYFSFESEQARFTPLHGYIKAWQTKMSDTEQALTDATSTERTAILQEYSFWKWNFPDSLIKKNPAQLLYRRDLLKEKMEQLSAELEMINKTLNS